MAQLVLNFVPDPVAVLNEMKRVTTPGGRIVAAVSDFRGGLVYQRMFWDTAAGMIPRERLLRSVGKWRFRSSRMLALYPPKVNKFRRSPNWVRMPGKSSSPKRLERNCRIDVVS